MKHLRKDMERTGNDILVATIPSVESRTYMDGASVKWSAGDKSLYFPKSNNSGSYANNEYTALLVRRVHKVQSFGFL